MMIDLTFLKSWGAYNAGESARFMPEIAQILVQKGIASGNAPAQAPEQQQTAEGTANRPILTTVRPDDKTKSLGK